MKKTTNAVKQPWGLIYPEFNQPLTAVNTCAEGILRRSRMFSSVPGKRLKTMQLFSVWGLILWTQLCIFPSLDAEPKYLVAVQPIPVNDVKKHCTGTAEPLPVWVNAATGSLTVSHLCDQGRWILRSRCTWWSTRSAPPRCCCPGETT